MASKMLALEIGPQITRVCVTQAKGKVYHILDSFIFLTPEGAVTDGMIIEPETVAVALRAQLRSHGAETVKNAIFTVNSTRIATRGVVLPPVKEGRIQALVDSSASEYFPIDLSRHHLTYMLTDRETEGKDAGDRVVVLAAPLALLEGYFKLAEILNLSIKGIDYVGNSQYQALKALWDKETVMYVNVNCGSAFTTFMQNGKLLLQRSLGVGGNETISRYMQSAGIPAEKYVDALVACSPEDDYSFYSTGILDEEEVADSQQRLVANIVRSHDYFRSIHTDVNVDRVVLLGPCCHLAGLRKAVGDAVGLETIALDELVNLSKFTNSSTNASFYISCMGSVIKPVNLMPERLVASRKKSKQKDRRDSLTGSIAVCLLFVAVGAGLSISALNNYNTAKNLKESLETEISQLEYAESIYNTFVAYKSGADSLLELESSIQSPNDELLDFIAELEDNMPSSITVLSAVCSRTDVSMSIQVSSYAEVAVVLSQLRDFDSLGDIQISAVSENLDETGGTYVSFTLVCTYAAKEIPADELVELTDTAETTADGEEAAAAEG